MRGQATAARFLGDLADLAGAADVEVPFVGVRSVKDLVESVGVPHTEVGRLTVDGRTVDFGRRLQGGESVEVHPFGSAAASGSDLRPGPPDPRRFVVDVHLGVLARRLRWLGFDSWYRTDADDAELAAVTAGEDRILLTRDRGLLMRREIVHGYLPRSEVPDQQLGAVAERYQLAERAVPLTRCVPCNGRLEPVNKADVVEVVPPRSAAAFDDFARCRRCGQVYWPGSHVEVLGRSFAEVVDRSRESSN